MKLGLQLIYLVKNVSLKSDLNLKPEPFLSLSNGDILMKFGEDLFCIKCNGVTGSDGSRHHSHQHCPQRVSFENIVYKIYCKIYQLTVLLKHSNNIAFLTT